MTSVLALTLAVAASAQENPFAGTWKLNLEKSSFTGDTVTFSPVDGGMQYSAGGLSYVAIPDGKFHPGLLGEIVSWTKNDEQTWEVQHKTKGVLTTSETLTISGDGKTLDDAAQNTKPNGEKYTDHFVYERVAGDKGILGTWKSTKAEIGSAQILEIKDYRSEGITVYSPSEKFTFSGKFDGKEYPATGPTVPLGANGTIKRKGPLAFELAEIFKGKAVWKGTYKVSEDKKTLSVTGSMTGADEPMIAVYDRKE